MSRGLGDVYKRQSRGSSMNDLKLKKSMINFVMKLSKLLLLDTELLVVTNSKL